MDWLQSQRDKLYNNTDKSDILAQPMALQLHQASFIFISSIILLFKIKFLGWAAPANPIVELTLFVNAWTRPNHPTKILSIPYSTG